MRKKSLASKNAENSNLWEKLRVLIQTWNLKDTKAAPESTMSASEASEGGTNPSLKKVKSPLARRSYKKNVNRFSVRRSERILNSIPRNFNTQSVIEEITLSESDEEDELPTEQEKHFPQPDQENGQPELKTEEKQFDEKIDYIVKLLETHGHTLDSMKTEVIKRSFSTESVPTTDIKYRNMYIASQKKIEELAEENRLLTQKLENALHQFDSYKNENHDALEMLEKLKDVILISNGLRASESTQATSQVELDKVTPVDADSSPPSSKRKKLTKQI